jgi:hypothetical protein
MSHFGLIMGQSYHLRGKIAIRPCRVQWHVRHRAMRAMQRARPYHPFGAGVSAPLLGHPGVPGREHVELSPRERCTSPPRQARRCLRIRKRRLPNLSARSFAIRQQPAEAVSKPKPHAA